MAVSSSVTRAVFGEQPSFQDVSKTVLVHFAICLIVRLASHTSPRKDGTSQFVPRGESESISVQISTLTIKTIRPRWDPTTRSPVSTMHIVRVFFSLHGISCAAFGSSARVRRFDSICANAIFDRLLLSFFPNNSTNSPHMPRILYLSLKLQSHRPALRSRVSTRPAS